METIKVKATTNGVYSFSLSHHNDFTNLSDTKVRGLKNLKKFLSSRNLMPSFWGFYGCENLVEKYNQI